MSRIARSPETGAATAGPALEPLLTELARPGRGGGHVPPADAGDIVPARFRRTVPLALPELAEQQVVRHFTHLAQLNYSVDSGFYPLGSCTMKYNPKVNDRAAALPGFADLHPLQPEQDTQGALRLIWELERLLAGITGLAEVSLQPAAGAHAELTALLMFKAYHQARGEGVPQRRRIIVPDSAHGTNPASAALCGYTVTTVRSDERGNVELAALEAALGDDVAGMMLTNPNTLGLFEERLDAVVAAVHRVGGLMYGDGANMNALLGVARPGDLGFDVLHLNLHKTFSTPHGAGGPGAGPVCATAALAPYLPVPRVVREGERFRLDADRPLSVGRVRAGHGNFGVLVRAYTYIRQLGEEGLRATGEDAILAANYLLARLRGTYRVAFDRPCMHEFVLTLAAQKKAGASALDVAKALIDEGFHPPTVYFPQIVPESMMIEPTETEPKETLDAFADALIRIAAEVVRDPAAVRAAPRTAPLERLDEVGAARNPRLGWDR